MKLTLLFVLSLFAVAKSYGGSSSSKANASSAFFPSYPLSNYDYEEGKKETPPELQTLNQVEKKIRSFIDAVIRQLLPYIIRASSDIHMSGKCMASVFKLVIGMQKLQEWAVRMVDATGKPPSGVIQGTSMSLGDFDECVNVRVTRGGDHKKQPIEGQEELFHGKYCTVECKLPAGIINALNEYNSAPTWLKANTSIGRSKTIFRLLGKFSAYVPDVGFRFGICVPSTCDEGDLVSITKAAVRNLGIPLKVLHCEEKQKLRFSKEQIIIIPIFAVIVCVVLVATALEIYYSQFAVNTGEKKGKWREIVENLSVANSTKRLFTVGEASCSHTMPMVQGFFFITVALNILAHTYFMYNKEYFYKYSSVLNLLDYMKQFTFTFLANGSNGIENYFFLAGFMIAFNRWRMKTVRLDLRSLLLKPYVRMTLLQLLTLCSFFCLPLFGYGPFWRDFVDRYLDNCRQRWWLNLFYIQNYWSAEESCLYHTWVLAVLMQLYVISILILWLLIRKPVFGVGASLIAIVLSMAVVGATVFVRELPGALSLYLVNLESGGKFWNLLYIRTFDHVGAFSIGILTGYLIGKYQKVLKFKPVIVLCGWIISSASLMAVIFGLYQYRSINDVMNPSVAILYAMLNRNVYSLFLAWLFIACATGNAWWIPHILSWKAIVPLYRLSFVAYLIHLVVIYYHVGITRERVYLSHEENIINYFGYLIITYFFSYVCYIFFQVPYMYVEMILSEYLSKKIPQWTGRMGSISNSSSDRTSTSDDYEDKKPSTCHGISISTLKQGSTIIEP